jgi:hypothetical protein
MMSNIQQLLSEFGFLAEASETRDLEKSVKDQINRSITKDEVDTVAFGLETDDGKIVKVYVNAENAEKFEQEMAEMLGEVDDIEEALNQISKDIEIVDVEWPEDDEDDDAEDDDDEADDAEAEDDGSEVMNSKVYSKKNLEKEQTSEMMSYGDELTQSLLEHNQNSIANQLSTVNQHLIYQAIMHLGVPELALDKSPYRSAILRGIKDTALELAHTPSMRNTLKIFIKQQAMDDTKAPDDEKHRGDAAKHHHGDETRKGMQAASVVVDEPKVDEPKKVKHEKPPETVKHTPKPIMHKKVKEAIEPIKPVDSSKPTAADEKQATGSVAEFWAAIDTVLNILDASPEKELVQQITGNQQYKSMVARSHTSIAGKLTAGIRAKLKNLANVMAVKGTTAVAEQFTYIDAEALLKAMFKLADKSDQLASRITSSQMFKRLMLAGRAALPSLDSSVKRALQGLMTEIEKVSLAEAADPEAEPAPEPKSSAAKPEDQAAEKDEPSTPLPEAPTPAEDATDSGVSFKAEGDSLTVNYQGGSFSLSGESLERAMKALTNKQTLSVQLDGGKFATFSPRGSSGVIKLMGTETKIPLAPPDISAFLDAGGQAVEGEQAENKEAAKADDGTKAKDEA